MDKQKVWPCKHCGRVFDSAGEWWSHNCDDEQTTATVAPAQRDVAAILDNAPRWQVEEDGAMLWA